MSKCIYTPKTLQVIDCKIQLQGEGSESNRNPNKNSGRKTATANQKGHCYERVYDEEKRTVPHLSSGEGYLLQKKFS